jgi:hypothetical protein
MYIAQEKLKTNISEYILYMFHIEDVIRACHLDIREIENNILPGYKLPETERDMVRKWYQNLIHQMKTDEVEQSGHITPLKEMMHRLNDLHISLLNTLQEEQYVDYYHWAKPVIAELKNKMKVPSLTEIEVCFDGLYGFMLLKLKHQEITMQTADSMGVFIQLLRYLSKRYHESVK